MQKQPRKLQHGDERTRGMSFLPLASSDGHGSKCPSLCLHFYAKKFGRPAHFFPSLQENYLFNFSALIGHPTQQRGLLGSTRKEDFQSPSPVNVFYEVNIRSCLSGPGCHWDYTWIFLQSLHHASFPHKKTKNLHYVLFAF